MVSRLQNSSAPTVKNQHYQSLKRYNMQVETKRLKPTAFQPFTLTLTIETREQFTDLSSLFSYYQTIPGVACSVFNERYQRMQDLLMKINDALDNEDQY